MASTVWRLRGFGVSTATLDISAVRLFAPGQVESTASVASSSVPSTGTLAALTDGNGATSCQWAKRTVEGGFWITFTFATAVEVSRVEIDTAGVSKIATLGVEQLVSKRWVTVFDTWFDSNESVSVGVGSAYQTAAIADGATTFLPCNAASGDEVDVVTGTALFNVSSNAIRTGQKLSAGTGAYFMPGPNGTSALLWAKNKTLGNLGANATIEFVMRGRPRKDPTDTIFTKDTDGAVWPEYLLREINGKTRFTVRSSNSDASVVLDLTGDFTILDDKRHHVVLTKAGLVYTLYVDGVVRLSGTATGNVFTSQGVLAFCSDVTASTYYPTSPFYGAVSGVSIYPTALTQAQVSAHLAALGPAVYRTVSTKRTPLLTVRSAVQPLTSIKTVVHPLLKGFDAEFGGTGRIYGNVAAKGTPTNIKLSRRVRLRRSLDSHLVAETWSDDTGYYEFRELTPRYEYDVEAWDHEKHYRSVLANNITPEV